MSASDCQTFDCPEQRERRASGKMRCHKFPMGYDKILLLCVIVQTYALFPRPIKSIKLSLPYIGKNATMV